MIDCLFWLDYSCLTYSNLLRFPFFMKLAHRLLFAVLFSFQRTIALSDLITLSRHISFVKFFFSFFYFSFFRLLPHILDSKNKLLTWIYLNVYAPLHSTNYTDKNRRLFISPPVFYALFLIFRNFLHDIISSFLIFSSFSFFPSAHFEFLL